MIYLIIILESILIIFWVDIKYDTSDTMTIITNTESYSSKEYNALDIVGNDILLFENIPEEKKVAIWLHSPLKEEMLSYSPNIQIMEAFFTDRVEDDGKFKESFLNYMREIHDEYIGTLITKEEFEKKISTLSSFKVSDY